MKMFWNKKNTTDRDPWDIQPEPRIRDRFGLLFLIMVVTVIAVFGLICAEWVANHVNTTTNGVVTTQIANDPAFNGSASIGGGMNVDDIDSMPE